MKLSALVILAAAAPALAQDYYGHVFASGDLVRVDLSNGNLVTLGNSGFVPGGLAFNRAPVPGPNGTLPANTLFAAGQDQNLYILNTANGSSTFVGNLGNGIFEESLTFDLSNNLITADQGSQRLMRVDTTNGSTSSLGNISGDWAPYDGLTCAPFNVNVQGYGNVPAGSLFGCDSGNMYWIDRNTLQSHLIASGTTANETLEFDPATGILYTHDFSGTIFRFDLGNLSSTPVAFNTGNIVGSAIAGVPTPGAAAILGLAGMGAARRRR